VDALLIQPLISSVAVTGPDGDSTLFVSATNKTSTRKIDVPEGFVLQQRAFDSSGRPFAAGRDSSAANHASRITIAAGGFTVVKLVRM
jgi:hypothetical protein